MAILTTTHDPIPHKLYSDELKDLINLLLTKDPKIRPSIQELIKIPIIWNALEALMGEERDMLRREWKGPLTRSWSKHRILHVLDVFSLSEYLFPA